MSLCRRKSGEVELKLGWLNWRVREVLRKNREPKKRIFFAVLQSVSSEASEGRNLNIRIIFPKKNRMLTDISNTNSAKIIHQK